jgi:small subunit ribosomal protein S8e
MSVWHGSQRKRKRTGGRKRAYRVKRNFEKGSFPAETTLGEPKRRNTRGYGGIIKTKVLKDKYVSVTDPKSGKTEKTEILRVVKNIANVDYDRRGVITKGAGTGSCYISPRQRRRHKRCAHRQRGKKLSIPQFFRAPMRIDPSL